MSHHRQHTLFYVKKASDYWLSASRAQARWLVSYTPRQELTLEQRERELFLIDLSVLHFNSIEHMLLEVAALLEDETSIENLLLARRIMNRPHNDPLSVSAVAVPYHWKNGMNTINQFLTTNSTPDLVFMYFEVAYAWQFTDHALWHLNDAILEEKYNEPAVQGTGTL